MMGTTSIYLARSFENTNLLERDQSTKAFEAARDLINATYRNNIPSQADMPSSQWVGECRTDDKFYHQFRKTPNRPYFRRLRTSSPD